MIDARRPAGQSLVPPARADSAEIVMQEDFAEFYTREIRNVVGLAYILSGSRTSAEDIAQDAFLAAYRHWTRVVAYQNPGGWVRRVAANRSISVGRRAVAEAKVLLRLRRERLTNFELSVENGELWAAVRRLPRRQAQVTALYYWERFSTHEIAKILELSEATVKTHLQRARHSLADSHRKD